MIWYIFGGLGVIGLFGIRNALQAQAAANIYTAVKDKVPPPLKSLDDDPEFRKWIRHNKIDYDFNHG